MANCEWCGGRVGLGVSCECYTVDCATKHPAIIKMQDEITSLRARIATALAAFREIWPDTPQHESAIKILAALEWTE